MIKKYIVTVAVDEDNVFDKYPNYQFNYNTPMQLLDSEGCADDSEERIDEAIKQYQDFGVAKVSIALKYAICKNCDFCIDGFCNEDKNRSVFKGKVPDNFGCIHCEPKVNRFLEEIRGSK